MNELIDYIGMPDLHLVERYNILQTSLEIQHNEPRLGELRHELACVAFEIMARVNSGELELEEVEEPVGLDPNSPNTWDCIESCD